MIGDLLSHDEAHIFVVCLLLQLTNYYSMHVCTPARAALMTGRYPVRYGMQYGVVSGGATWGMPPQEKVRCYRCVSQASRGRGSEDSARL